MRTALLKILSRSRGHLLKAAYMKLRRLLSSLALSDSTLPSSTFTIVIGASDIFSEAFLTFSSLCSYSSKSSDSKCEEMFYREKEAEKQRVNTEPLGSLFEHATDK